MHSDFPDIKILLALYALDFSHLHVLSLWLLDLSFGDTTGVMGFFFSPFKCKWLFWPLSKRFFVHVLFFPSQIEAILKLGYGSVAGCRWEEPSLVKTHIYLFSSFLNGLVQVVLSVKLCSFMLGCVGFVELELFTCLSGHILQLKPWFMLL
jgi:hypothetical protein